MMVHGRLLSVNRGEDYRLNAFIGECLARLLNPLSRNRALGYIEITGNALEGALEEPNTESSRGNWCSSSNREDPCVR